MGFWKSIGSVLTGGISDIVGGLFSGAGAVASTAMSNNANMKMMKMQQQYNTSEREASQVYNTSERLSSQRFQDQQRTAQNKYAEDMYNQYQSPQALYDQYAEAGLNPRLAIDSGSVGRVNVSGGSSGGAPSGTHVQPMGINPPYMQNVGYAQAFQTMAESLKSLGEAKKLGIDTKYLEEEWKKKLKGMDLDNDIQEFTNLINYKYMDQEKFVYLQNALQDLSNKQATHEQLMQIIKGLTYRNIIDKNEADHWLEQYEAKLRNLNSETNLNVSSAHERDTAATEHNANAANALSQRDLHNVQINTELAQQKLLKAKAYNTSVDSDYKLYLGELTKYQSRLAALQYEISYDPVTKAYLFANGRQSAHNVYLRLKSQFNDFKANKKLREHMPDFMQEYFAYVDYVLSAYGKIFGPAAGVAAAAIK